MQDSLEKIKILVSNYAGSPNLTVLSSERIETLKSEFPNMPGDYIEFLREIGHGTFGRMAFRIYGGPLDPDEIYDETTANRLVGILLVGDDYSDCTYAYDTMMSPWKVCRLDQGKIAPFEKGEPTNFVSFILNEFCRSFEIEL